MFCANCGSEVPDECRFCPSCGRQMISVINRGPQVNGTAGSGGNFQQQFNPGPIPPQGVRSVDQKEIIAQKMSIRCIISGILVLIPGIIYLAASISMLASYRLVQAVLEDYPIGSIVFNGVLPAVFYIILSIVRFLQAGRIRKNISYHANRVVTTSGAICGFTIVTIIELFTKFRIEIFGGLLLWLFLFIAIEIYEIIAIIVFAYSNRSYFQVTIGDSLADIPAYVEQPSRWDEQLKNETIEPVDENNEFYNLYMGFTKEKLAAVLDHPEEYQPEAVKTARAVFYKRFSMKS